MNILLIRLSIYCLLVIPIIACQSTTNFTDKTKNKLASDQPNIILMIGDGMGIPQVSTAFYFGVENISFQRFNKIGLSITESFSHKVPDSASGATAIATGVKTYNRAISVSPDSLSIPTILEQLRDQKNYLTGLISLTTLTHATPACFYAHVKDRDQHEEIARQLCSSNIDFLAGGGLQYLTQREDGINLFAELERQNYQLDTTQLGPVELSKRNAFLLAKESLPSKIEGRTDFLQHATSMALSYFTQKEKPFFLMIEGSYIDWAGHAENPQMLIEEVNDFNKTINLVLDFIKTNPNTLVIVTADHETGGVSLEKKYHPIPIFGQKSVIPEELEIAFNSNQHSAELVPVFAKGIGEELFQGIYPNYDLYHKIMLAIQKRQIRL